jgi:colanic acid biosynthesis glycosyl transferase WcaI
MTQPAQSGAVSKPPKIYHLSQLFDPEPTFKGHDFVKGLEESGFEVEVVTGFPNYPGGTVYDGYKIRPLVHEEMGETQITRLAMYPSHDNSALKRIATYISFMVSSCLYLTFRAGRSDLIYVYYPALTAGLAAVVAKFFRGTPVLLDVQDMWPDSLSSSHMMPNRYLLGIANAACNFLYRRCDHILVLSPGFKELLIHRGVPAEKISIVYNWADESVLPDVNTLPNGFSPDDGFRVLFAGNMGLAQQLDTVIEAAEKLQSEDANCVFYFMGDGIDKDRLATRSSDLGLTNVRFLPRVPLQDVQRFLAAADALLVHLNDEPLFRITIPSKTQAYLYAGRPILMGVAGDAADLVQQAGAGYPFLPGDSDALAHCVRQLIGDGAESRAQMGHNAQNFYSKTLSRSKGIGATVDLINRFLKGPDNSGSVKGVST